MYCNEDGAYGDIPHMQFDPQPEFRFERPQVSWGLRRATLVALPVGSLMWVGVIKVLIWVGIIKFLIWAFN